jgi:hypothetical protein
MVIGAVVLVAVLLLFVARRRRKVRRGFSSDVFAELLELRRPYSGPSWRTGGRWL